MSATRTVSNKRNRIYLISASASPINGWLWPKEPSVSTLVASRPSWDTFIKFHSLLCSGAEKNLHSVKIQNNLEKIGAILISVLAIVQVQMWWICLSLMRPSARFTCQTLHSSKEVSKSQLEPYWQRKSFWYAFLVLVMDKPSSVHVYQILEVRLWHTWRWVALQFTPP